MTPREVLKLTLVTSGLFRPDARETISDAMADTILRNLKSARLFIGPEVATEEMLNTSGYQDADEVWADMVTEWKRGGGT